jgi:hypothetical protein
MLEFCSTNMSPDKPLFLAIDNIDLTIDTHDGKINSMEQLK